MAESPRDQAGNPLALLSVHAHPDDEASKGAGTVARYSDEGVRTRARLLHRRRGGRHPQPGGRHARGAGPTCTRSGWQELQASADAIGYDVVDLLGYHDSGMPDTETNARPDNFANAPLDEAVERLVRIVRAERPQVIVTYDEDRKFYPHPDHIRVHEISVPGVRGRRRSRPLPGRGRAVAAVEALLHGLVAPAGRRRCTTPTSGSARRARTRRGSSAACPRPRRTSRRSSTSASTSHRRRAALLAHRTQVDPEGFWMRLPDDVLREVFPWEEFVLARSLVDTGLDEGEPEDDLFAGLRAEVPSPR